MQTSSAPLEHPELGAKVTEYPEKPPGFRAKASPFLILIASVIPFGIAIVLTAAVITGDQSTQASAFLPMALCWISGLVMSFVGIGTIYTSRNFGNRRLVLYENGFAWIKGKWTEVTTWDSIESIVRTKTYDPDSDGGPSLQNSLSIKRRDGKTIEFDFKTFTFDDFDQVVTTIMDAVMSRLLPQYLEAYHAGRTLNFGKWSLSQAGISGALGTLPWNEIVEAKLAHADQYSFASSVLYWPRLEIMRKGSPKPWYSADLAVMPNATLFQHLVELGIKGDTRR